MKDLRYGNVRLRTLIVGLAIVTFNKLQSISRRVLPPRLRLRGGRFYPFYQGTGTGARTPELDLVPGQSVEIRSQAEIEQTLNEKNTNRGMWFDFEMLPYTGQQARVERKVERIINEATGKMMKLSDCHVLEGVTCTGIYRRFCPRNVTPYWRSAWLRPVEQEEAAPTRPI